MPRPPRASWCGTAIDTVLVRNQIDPLPTSGVDQEAYLASGEPVSLATDRAWSDALRAAGTARLPDDRAVLRSRAPAIISGRATSRREWQPGCRVRLVSGRLSDARWLPRGQDRSLATRRRRVGTGRSLSVVHTLPRVLGELGSWLRLHRRRPLLFLPAVSRPVCAKSLGSSSLPAMPRPRRASFSKSTASAWTAWRARRIDEVIDRIAAAVRTRHPDLEIMLNTLAFPGVRLRWTRRAAGDRGAGSRGVARVR